MVVGALERCSDTPVMRYEDCPPGLRARQPADPLRGAHRPPHGNGWSGGAERVLSLLATELQSAGATSVAFLPVRREGGLEAELAPAGVTVEYVPLTRPVSPGYARALAAAFRRHRIELAHSHEFTMAFYGAWAARRAGIPHVITMHGSRYYAGRWRRRLALRAAVATSAGVAAVSRPPPPPPLSPPRAPPLRQY